MKPRFPQPKNKEKVIHFAWIFVGVVMFLLFIALLVVLFGPFYLMILGNPLDDGKEVPLIPTILVTVALWVPFLWLVRHKIRSRRERQSECEEELKREEEELKRLEEELMELKRKVEEGKRKVEEQMGEVLKRMEQLQGERLSPDRRERLRERVPLYRKLPDELKSKLEERMLLFLDLVEFRTKGDIQITEEMRDVVSAEACLLIVNRSYMDYFKMDFVEIWKDPMESIEGVETVGLAKFNSVKLHWDAVEYSLSNAKDNWNVTLHEFAHVLDFADDSIAQSIPVPEDTEEYENWESMLDREYPRLQKAHASGHGHVIDKYGTKASGDRRLEFFPCATESFFERSLDLKEKNPEIYDLLNSFYQLDPAEWEEGSLKLDAKDIDHPDKRRESENEEGA